MSPSSHHPHRPPSGADDPEPGLLPVDPDDGIVPPWTPAETDADPPADPEA